MIGNTHQLYRFCSGAFYFAHDQFKEMIVKSRGIIIWIPFDERSNFRTKIQNCQFKKKLPDLGLNFKCLLYFFYAEKPLSGKGRWSDIRFSFTKSQELFAQI